MTINAAEKARRNAVRGRAARRGYALTASYTGRIADTTTWTLKRKAAGMPIVLREVTLDEVETYLLGGSA